MIINVKGSEGSLTANSTVNSARAVRLYNSHTADILITVQDDSAGTTTIGTFTAVANTVVFVEKKATEYLAANNNGGTVLVTNVGFTIS